ncbi:ABC transporter permease [Oceanobacillus manasiensis]|uniref:ABC transporter permease n=1 Tax=Oceanobacillus manasiensis TaxID=586413 RepID=UPI0005A698FE|nr:ABC transporter permease [Oceanobacillus manasiensis]
MKAIVQTRLIHLKKHWVSLIFWLAFPVIATVAIMGLTNSLQQDSKVPVGIVLEETTPLATTLVDSIKRTPIIQVYQLSEEEALYQLQQHKLDSVFIIQDGYEEQIMKGSRNRLIKSYRSDLSFAYTPIAEMIISYVQQDTGRTKAAYTIQELNKQYSNSTQNWTWGEIIEKSKDIEKEENLLYTTFRFFNADTEADANQFVLFNPWGLWAVFAFLSTCMIMDWIIKERRKSLTPRFSFMHISLKSYLLKNAGLYLLLFIIVDIMTLILFKFNMREVITQDLIGSILSFRLILLMGAFLLAILSTRLPTYYGISFILTLIIAIISGAILPNEGLMTQYPWLEIANPLAPFLSREIGYGWFIVFGSLIGIWFVRKEKRNVKGA